MSDEIKITFACKSCGADPTTLELPDDYTDDDIAKCKLCGFEFGPYRDIKSKAIETAKAQVVSDMKKALKGRKGISFKEK